MADLRQLIIDGFIAYKHQRGMHNQTSHGHRWEAGFWSGVEGPQPSTAFPNLPTSHFGFGEELERHYAKPPADPARVSQPEFRPPPGHVIFSRMTKDELDGYYKSIEHADDSSVGPSERAASEHKAWTILEEAFKRPPSTDLLKLAHRDYAIGSVIDDDAVKKMPPRMARRFTNYMNILRSSKSSTDEKMDARRNIYKTLAKVTHRYTDSEIISGMSPSTRSKYNQLFGQANNAKLSETERAYANENAQLLMNETLDMLRYS